MIQTSYVPLEHPFQIVEYNGTLGIQIGTLIVTKDKSDESEKGYAIETHSHPVVSYVNNRVHTDPKHPSTITLPKPYEGVVWDKVELHELTMITREGGKMSWRDFMDYCRKIRLRVIKGSKESATLSIFDTYGQLTDWGIKIVMPQSMLRVELTEFMDLGNKMALMTAGDLGIAVDCTDRKQVVRTVIKQVVEYLSFMEYHSIYVSRIKFWTQNLFMQDLTEELNKEVKFTEREDLAALMGKYEDEESMAMCAEPFTEVK